MCTLRMLRNVSNICTHGLMKNLPTVFVLKPESLKQALKRERAEVEVSRKYVGHSIPHHTSLPVIHIKGMSLQ